MFGFGKKKKETDPKVSAHEDKEFPTNHQLREARIGLIGVRNYIVGRMNNGDPLFDQWMVDALELSQAGLHNLDKLEDALGVRNCEEIRKEVNKLLITRMNFTMNPTEPKTPSDNQSY